jgi:hypothetical protein
MRSHIIQLVLIAVCSLACDQNKTAEHPQVPEPNCGIRVKVIYNFCSYIFLQILDAEYFSLGEDQWKSADGTTYEHVFMVNNFCEFGDSHAVNNLFGKEFEISIVSEYSNECATCKGGYTGKLPESKLAIQLCTNDER